MRRYEDFARITEGSLRYACAALGLPVDEERRRSLARAYLKLSIFPEVRDALAALRDSRLKLAILSNGSPAMLRPLVANAGLRGLIGIVISVDQRKIYKPAPAVYRLAVQRLRVPKPTIGFVSSNCWDACGAKSFGFRTFWINRTGAHVDQVHIFYRARLLDRNFGPGEETLEVGLFRESAIPWKEIAFRTISTTLRYFYEDRKAGAFGFHAGEILPPK